MELRRNPCTTEWFYALTLEKELVFDAPATTNKDIFSTQYAVVSLLQ